MLLNFLKGKSGIETNVPEKNSVLNYNPIQRGLSKLKSFCVVCCSNVALAFIKKIIQYSDFKKIYKFILKWGNVKKSKKKQNNVNGSKNNYRILLTNNDFFIVLLCGFIIGFFFFFFLAILLDRCIADSLKIRYFRSRNNSTSSFNIGVKNKRNQVVKTINSNPNYIEIFAMNGYRNYNSTQQYFESRFDNGIGLLFLIWEDKNER